MVRSSRLSAILIALLVTFLWSTSFIIIKIGLHEIPPVLFAGLRYSLAFMVLVPFLISENNRRKIRNLTNAEWRDLLFLGMVFYFFTQGSQFIGLSLLPAVTVSLILNLTPIIVALMGIFFLQEYPSKIQWTGTLLFVLGIIIYFYPVIFTSSQLIGILVMLIGVVSNAGSSVIGRGINRKGNIEPLVVTGISMGIGAVLLLTTGIITEGLPEINAPNFLLLLWLAVINTALAFTLWNISLKTLTAIESSIINGTMLIQIALLAWFFIGERIDIQEGSGMIIAGAGAIIVQIGRRRKERRVMRT